MCFDGLIAILETKDNFNKYYLELSQLNSVNKFYLYCPSERMADLYTSNQIVKIINNEKFKKLIKPKIYYYILHTYRELRGYSDENGRIIAPTVKYKYEYELVNQRNDKRVTNPNINFEDYKYRIIGKSLDINDRLYYGLPISQNEYKLILQKRDKFIDLYK